MIFEINAAELYGTNTSEDHGDYQEIKEIINFLILGEGDDMEFYRNNSSKLILEYFSKYSKYLEKKY